MFCTKMRSKLKRLLQQIDQYVDEHAETALRITTTLKGMLESPVADIVTAIIPGDADELIRKHLIAALELATNALSIANECAAQQTLNEKLQCFVTQLRKYPPEVQDALLQKLASLLTKQLDGSRGRQSLYDLYTQAKYAAGKQQEVAGV
jgi:hypothetical protein